MPYCSIQEAWGSSFNKENNIVENFDSEVPKKNKNKRRKRRGKKYKKIEDQIPKVNNDQEFQKWKYKNNLLEERNNEKEENEYNYFFTRGINNLPEHNGNENRVDPAKISFEKDNIVIEDEGEDEYEDEEGGEGEDEISNIYEEDTYGDELKDNEIVSDKKGSKHNLSFIVSKLEKVINLLSVNNSGQNNLTHAILFIFTGIFIIFIIDNAFRMGKNFRD